MKEETTEQKMCEHKYLVVDKGISYPHPANSSGAQFNLNFVRLVCEKCGLTKTSYF